jgi:hypothetical protein
LSSSNVHLPSLKSSMAWSNTDCCFGVIAATYATWGLGTATSNQVAWSSRGASGCIPGALRVSTSAVECLGDMYTPPSGSGSFQVLPRQLPEAKTAMKTADLKGICSVDRSAGGW